MAVQAEDNEQVTCTPVGLWWLNGSDNGELYNVTHQVTSTMTTNLSFIPPDDDDLDGDMLVYEDAKIMLYQYVLPILCCFGILGNLLNLVILSRKSLTMHMERLEKCAHAHLLALAVSDLMYCVSALPRSSMPSFVHASYISAWVLYDTYHGAMLNTFLLCSSWLTVAMAVSRYIAICYPVKARQHMGITATRTVIALIFFVSFCFNMPRYFSKSVHSIQCQEGGRSYYADKGPFHNSPLAEEIYLWIYFVVGIIFPLLAVSYCNVYFIRALQSSKQLRRSSGHTSNSSSVSKNSAPNILTLTLSIIVLLYIVLVTPAEIIQFFRQTVRRRFLGNNRVLTYYSLASAVCNNLQTLNFSVNFLLYCMINVHFRRVIKSFVLCHFRKQASSSASSSAHRVTLSERSTMFTHAVTVNL